MDQTANLFYNHQKVLTYEPSLSHQQALNYCAIKKFYTREDKKGKEEGIKERKGGRDKGKVEVKKERRKGRRMEGRGKKKKKEKDKGREGRN